MKKYVFAFLSVVMLITSFTVLGDDNIGKTLDEKFPKVNKYKDNFKDVSSNDWFYDNVIFSYELGLMVGGRDTRGNELFMPDEHVSLGQAVIVSARIHSAYYGIPIPEAKRDSSYGLWYDTSHLDYAIEHGIMTADQFGKAISEDDPERHFNLTRRYMISATRHEVVSLISNALPIECYIPINLIDLDFIPDVNHLDDFYLDVLKFYSAGITMGTDDKGTFSPYAEIKRSELSAILSRLVNDKYRVRKDLTYQH